MAQWFLNPLLMFFLATGPRATAELSVPRGDAAWWQKPAMLKRLREERDVVISVKGEPHSRYSMTGAGDLRSSRESAVKTLLAFHDLEKVSPYFKKVVHQPEYNRVYFLLEAYGYEARLLIKYSVENLPEKTVFHWNVVWGGFQGMIGSIEFTTLKADKTEAVMISQFDDRDIPLPRIFTGFVLEAVVQQVAKSMRGYIEDQYAKTKGQR